MNRYGVVGVVEAILLISLFAIILAIIQLTYIPKLMENKEAEHMDQVSNQFSQLKMAIDILSISRTNLSITVPLKLGSREIPYFITARSIGEVCILEDAFRLSIKTSSNYTNFSIGIIKYDANNVYYVKQSYILENGAILLRQNNIYDTMLSPPTISSEKNGNIISLNFLVVNISGYAGRTAESGLDVTFIRTNYSSYSPYDFTDVEKITIFTSFLDPWFRFFNYSMENLTVTKNDNSITIQPKNGYQLNLHLDVVKIFAQIGRGWISNQ